MRAGGGRCWWIGRGDEGITWVGGQCAPVFRLLPGRVAVLLLLLRRRGAVLLLLLRRRGTVLLLLLRRRGTVGRLGLGRGAAAARKAAGLEPVEGLLPGGILDGGCAYKRCVHANGCV